MTNHIEAQQTQKPEPYQNSTKTKTFTLTYLNGLVFAWADLSWTVLIWVLWYDIEDRLISRRLFLILSKTTNKNKNNNDNGQYI